MPVAYKRGDAALANPNRTTIIAHVVNDVGAWGRGFVIALAKRYPRARSDYRKGWSAFRLGEVQWVFQDGVRIANMFAQRDVVGPKPRVRYGALQRCLTEVFELALDINAIIHMPRVGCGLGGGSWDVVKSIIDECIQFRYDADVVIFGGKGRSL